MADVMNSNDILTESARHGSALTIAARVLKDPQTIKVQADTVRSNIRTKQDRVHRLAEMLELACADCRHMRSEHASRGRCYAKGCECEEWVVVDGE